MIESPLWGPQHVAHAACVMRGVSGHVLFGAPLGLVAMPAPGRARPLAVDDRQGQCGTFQHFRPLLKKYINYRTNNLIGPFVSFKKQIKINPEY
ncbi:hypothetical protein [Sphingomonas sp. ERG5]|uniref:hypothetical protein n=1 Tax=Sphingomonas sp. ERG5 TaxID=1381597 RepID=UPI001364D84C|nr:hypothetical protein [Sphingomonas sp. ERG5]